MDIICLHWFNCCWAKLTHSEKINPKLLWSVKKKERKGCTREKITLSSVVISSSFSGRIWNFYFLSKYWLSIEILKAVESWTKLISWLHIGGSYGHLYPTNCLDLTVNTCPFDYESFSFFFYFLFNFVINSVGSGISLTPSTRSHLSLFL